MMLDNPSPMSFREVVDIISSILGEERSEVEEKVWMEALYAGYNVSREAKAFGIQFHVYDQRMEAFYRETTGFIYETFVEHCRPGKQKVLHFIRERLEALLSQRDGSALNVLMLGDSVGSDTRFFHQTFGDQLQLHYFDVPGSKTYEFARKFFEKTDTPVMMHTEYSAIPDNFFDVIVCLEVLEHLPEPESAIRDIYRFLKEGGLVFVSESFSAVQPNLPAHLASNLKLVGKTPFLFLRNRLIIVDYSKDPLLLSRPMVFEKRSKIDFKKRKNVYMNKALLSAY